MVNVVRYLILILLAFFLTSCLSFEVGRYGHDPAEDLDWNKIIQRATDAGRNSREVSLAIQGTIIPRESDLAIAVDQAFTQVSVARKGIISRSKKPFFSSDVFYDLRERQSSLDPSITIIATDVPLATTFPDGSILISRKMIDGLIGDTIDSNYWGLRAIAAHELAHHADAHAVYNWLARGGEQRTKARNVASGLSAVTSILPISFRYKNSPGYRYANLKHHPVIFEFIADYWAYYTLLELGAPEGTMRDTLIAIRDTTQLAVQNDEDLQFSSLIDRRAKCMSLLTGPSLIQKPASVYDLGFFNTNIFVLATPEGLKRITSSETEELVEDRIKAASRENTIPDGTDSPNGDGIPPDFAYWFCAMAALVEIETENSSLTKLFASDEPEKIAEAFSRHAEYQQSSKTDTLVFMKEIDGIPLVEAAMAYSAPKPDLRQNVFISKDLEYTGLKDTGLFAFDLEFGNDGRSTAALPIIIFAEHKGRRVPIALKSAEFRKFWGDNEKLNDFVDCNLHELTNFSRDCRSVQLTEELSAGHHHKAQLFVYLPELTAGSLESLSVSINPCANKIGAQSDCNQKEKAIGDNSRSVKFGVLPDLLGYSRSTHNSKHSLGITNMGYQDVTVPFEINLQGNYGDLVLTSCLPERYVVDQDNCEGVSVTDPIPAGGSITVDFYTIKKSTNSAVSYGGGFLIDACPQRLDEEFANCAVSELNEHNNEYGNHSGLF